jgi:tRNA-dependent cyclodipeptide synthase
MPHTTQEEKTMAHDSLPNPVYGFHANPLSDRCRHIWQRGDHALIGVSTGNSYFTQERLTALLNWAGHFFAHVDVMYTDIHIDTMLIASGHNVNQAMKLTKSRLRDVRRRIRRAMERLSSDPARFRVRPLSDFLAEQKYQSLYTRVHQAVDSNRHIASVCENMVRRFLVTQSGNGDGSAESMRAGLSYLLAELPFFVDSPDIFGFPSSALCYHISTPLVEYLVQPRNGILDTARNQGFIVVRPSATVHPPLALDLRNPLKVD